MAKRRLSLLYGALYVTLAAAFAIAALPDARAQQSEGVAERNRIRSEALELRRKIAKQPRAAKLREPMAALAIRWATGAERALSVGDERLFRAYEADYKELFHDTRWRLAELAKRRNGQAAHALAVIELHGLSGKPDLAAACGHFAEAVAEGFNFAKFRAAQCHAEKDSKRSALLMKEAADAGNAWALEIVGRRCLETTPPDPTCAHDHLLAASAAGRPSAQVLLGWMLAQGIAGPPDLQRAIKLYRQAADKGFASAQNNLGELYESGRGVSRDAVQALQWYRAGAEAGFAPAQFNFGRALATGLGGAVDIPTAREWLLKAEAGGIAQARTMLNWLQSKTP